MTDQERQLRVQQLVDALEEDSKAMEGLVQSCGSLLSLTHEQQGRFEELLAHQDQLLDELRALEAEPHGWPGPRVNRKQE